MTEHATPNTAPPAADLFEIIRTARSMRRLNEKPIGMWLGGLPAANQPDAASKERPKASETLGGFTPRCKIS
jgi:hypothetical protein